MTPPTPPPPPAPGRGGLCCASSPPILTVQSGDTVVLECVSGRKEVLPPPESGLAIPPALRAIIDADLPSLAGHILTGPVAVDGADPGDMLEIRIEAIELGADWGYNMIRALAGTLPDDFHATTLTHLPVDRERKICTMPWGTELSLSPFF